MDYDKIGQQILHNDKIYNICSIAFGVIVTIVGMITLINGQKSKKFHHFVSSFTSIFLICTGAGLVIIYLINSPFKPTIIYPTILHMIIALVVTSFAISILISAFAAYYHKFFGFTIGLTTVMTIGYGIALLTEHSIAIAMLTLIPGLIGGLLGIFYTKKIEIFASPALAGFLISKGIYFITTRAIILKLSIELYRTFYYDITVIAVAIQMIIIGIFGGYNLYLFLKKKKIAIHPLNEDRLSEIVYKN
ncbi:hypothetical protein K502DRAFT_351203 [Neoconidiobolus thromboides FSU 785]|nr:hypothetical protein K502DRAFT_351203 [Neoconidiobolus thromboides FSU 785]